MNYSSKSRKAQVLAKLKQYEGQWLNGTELATEEVGGSEGLKRLRELRADGFPIERRQHPDRGRDIYQYRLLSAQQQKGLEVPPPMVQTTWLDDDGQPQDGDELVAAWLQ